ncbi:MAG: hypothetical protein WC529_05595 [Candidatus Margulisiibacteriota bacterium]
MKNLIALFLALMIGSQSAVFALAIDKDKLLTLKPLCSQRIASQAADYDANKPWVAGSFGLIGLGLMQANSGGTIDNNKLGGLTIGLMSVLASALLYLSPGEPVIQNDTLNGLGLTGAEKELAAYSILKSNAEKSKDARKDGGLLLAGSGLGFALISALTTGATPAYKDSLNTGALVFAVLGIVSYLNPGAGEREVDEIDKAVATP